MPMLFQPLVQSRKNTTHLVQYLHHRENRFFATAPYYNAANTAILHFGCACEYTLHMRVRVVIHVKLHEGYNKEGRGGACRNL